ncbi:MAG: hypothetical protein ABEJ80_03690 [Halarchaeum sp.]
MAWTETDPDRRWERDDGDAVVTVRETATGAWAVTFDRLLQAPEGEDYRHEKRDDEADALELAAEWRAAER